MIDSTTVSNIDDLDDQLSKPTDGVIQAMSQLDGDILLLGAGGKMGPTLARMAQRASEAAGVARRVMAASRFHSPGVRERIDSWGIETYSCDLLDADSLAKLPDAANVILMTGFKFGAGSNPGMAWAMNCLVPAIACQRFRQSRMAVFSSGNVYGMTSVAGGGSRENDPVRPQGEYAITVLGRERMVEYFSRELGIPSVILRLNYATELRYGVLVDLARQVASEQTIDVTMGSVNVIWQAEANAMSLQAFALADTPPRILNIAGHEILRVRDIAHRFGELMGKPVQLEGQEADDAFLNNATASHEAFGRPAVDAEQMIRWTADWVARDGEWCGKPTHYATRDGKF